MNMEKELQNVKQHLQECQDKYSAEVSKNVKLTNEAKHSNFTITMLKQNVKTNTSGTDMISTYNNNLKKDCKKLEQNIQSLKLQYKGALNEIDGLTKMNHMMERKFNRVEKELREFQLHGENKRVLAQRLKGWSARAKKFAFRLKEEAKSNDLE